MTCKGSETIDRGAWQGGDADLSSDDCSHLWHSHGLS